MCTRDSYYYYHYYHCYHYYYYYYHYYYYYYYYYSIAINQLLKASPHDRTSPDPK